MHTLHVFHGDAAELHAAIGELRGSPPIVAWSEPEQLAAEIESVHALLAPVPPPVPWARAHRLTLLQLGGAGIDGLIPEALPERVTVCNARGLFSAEVAEHAIAVALALVRDVPRLVAQQAARRWDRFASPSLAGRTLAILGLGAIGSRIARIGRALDMRVVGTCRRPRPILDVDAAFGPDHTAQAIADAAVVIVALPRTQQTLGLLDAAMLACLRPDAILVVISRGGIVDEAALADALRSGRLAGAALDVFADEPLPPDDPLWTTPRVLLSPHVAGLGIRYLPRLLALFLDNVARMRSGGSPNNRVDRVAGY